MEIMKESPEKRYRDALEAGRFEIQECVSCNRRIFPPRVVCPGCGGSSLEWRPSNGKGSVHACTIVARREESGGPYNVVLVDLDEGVRLMSHVTGFGAAEVPVGLSVRARIEPDTSLLVFDSAEGSGQ